MNLSDMLKAMAERTGVTLQRSKDLIDLTNDLCRRTFDDPEYLFYNEGTYFNKWKDFEENWIFDALGIYYNEVYAGTISYHMDRDHDRVYGVAIALEPKYLNTGIGMKALAKWIYYIFCQRNARKITFSVCDDNLRGKKAYEKLLECGARYVGTYKDHVKLVDGKYYDKSYYELLKEDFKPSKLFLRLVQGKRTAE